MFTVQFVPITLLQAVTTAPQAVNLKNAAETLKDATAALQSIATVIALIVGGIWTFRAFVKTREHQPRAKIEHVVSHRILPNKQYLLVLDVFVENVGQVAIRLRSSKTWLQQIVPLPHNVQCLADNGQDIAPQGESEAKWTLLGRVHEKKYELGQYVIDSGERDQFRHNFNFSSDVQTIQIYTYLETPEGSPGWKLKTTYDFPSPEPARWRPRMLLRRGGH